METKLQDIQSITPTEATSVQNHLLLMVLRICRSKWCPPSFQGNIEQCHLFQYAITVSKFVPCRRCQSAYNSFKHMPTGMHRHAYLHLKSTQYAYPFSRHQLHALHIGLLKALIKWFKK